MPARLAVRSFFVLSESSAAIVAATAPVVAEHAEAITRCFYPRMFQAHPELLRIFNTAHQATGEQPKALALSVVAYAGHLLDPRADLQPMIDRIVHRHVSLGIRPEHYPIVGHHLLAAVGEVLGEAVTPEVAAAWDEVYWLFAVELIAAEARLYVEAAADPATPWRRWTVVERIEETADVVSLRLIPADGGAVPRLAAGQYVSVAVDLPGGERQARQYSVSSARPDVLQISVKRVDGGEDAPAGLVSQELHRHATVGTELELGPIAGDVTLAGGDGPVALISAGIGSTPLVAMLESLADRASEQEILVAHADRAPSAHAMRGAQEAAVRRLPNVSLHRWYEDGADEASRTGLMDLSPLEISPETTAYLCGPLPFMRAARTQLLQAGVPAERIHYEVFGPDVWIAQSAQPEAVAA
jgi:nitric oxide dioxygenase